jgi:hypothetical protein
MYRHVKANRRLPEGSTLCCDNLAFVAIQNSGKVTNIVESMDRSAMHNKHVSMVQREGENFRILLASAFRTRGLGNNCGHARLLLGTEGHHGRGPKRQCRNCRSELLFAIIMILRPMSVLNLSFIALG